MFTRLWPAVLFAVLWPAGLNCFGQSLTLGGFVVDPSGAGVPKAPVEVHAVSGATAAQSKSAGNGSFRVPGLRAGDYVLTVPAFSSFAERTMRVHVATNLTDVRV